MKPISTLIVKPALPKPLQGLEALAYNLRWTWNPDSIDLFRRIDPVLWESVYHNPVRMIDDIGQERLDQLSKNPGFMAHFKRVSESLRAFMDGETYFSSTHGKTASDIQIAYFSAEFGLTESLPIYSGGLGVLAGDHLKSASTLGLPFAAVGLLYQHGYFHQYLTNDGWQQEEYPENDYYAMPVQIARDDQGRDITLTLAYPEAEAQVRIWKAQVGRVPLYLLDTNVMENPPSIREITAQLYGGDRETRIRQEILLGIGGVRALNALGKRPTVCHMNEGHSAFLGLERIRQAMRDDRATFDQALESTTAGHVFTTHTPVPAGHDVFPATLMEKYFNSYAHDLGISMPAFLALGRENPENDGDEFNMTVLAFRLSAYRNGVSRLHGQVSRKMWQSLWPGVPENEIPIASITNGVHIASHLSQQMRGLEDNYMGPRRLEEPHDQSVWETIDHIPAEELWRVHERRRERLVAFARQRLRQQLQRETASPIDMARADEVLTADALTIGFARRFATYKRATLLFHDLERLTRILCNEDQPVQVIFAGKAHPQDHAGKELIQEIFGLTQRDYLHRRLIFIENYDMCVARYLVQGVDIWLNTPVRPQEASGTSGMKAVANGALKPQRARRVVGRGIPPGTGLGNRTRQGIRRPGVSEPDRGARPLQHPGKRSRAPVLRPRRRWIAAQVDRPHEKRHARVVSQIQHPPHGAGLHRAILPRSARALKNPLCQQRRESQRARPVEDQTSPCVARSRHSCRPIQPRTNPTGGRQNRDSRRGLAGHIDRARCVSRDFSRSGRRR